MDVFFAFHYTSGLRGFASLIPAYPTEITTNLAKTCYTQRMIADRDRRIIEEIAAKYHAKGVVLFGSSLSPDKESRDIDIGVEGIEQKDFFTFYGELLCALSKSVDVVDMSVESRFVKLIRLEGISFYA